jgi:DNA-binding HxlR family transcriptional regulator
MALRETKKLRSGCPIATTLDLLGDRWTLVIVRDMVMGKKRFGDFLKSPERIPTNILTDRLARLAEFGLLEKRSYQDNPVRFEYR